MHHRKAFIGFIAFCIIFILGSLTIEKNIILKGNIKESDMNITAETGKFGLGDYIFLMSPSPNDDESGSVEELSKYSSYLVVTNQKYEILKSIKVDGYYDQIMMSKDFNIVLYNLTSSERMISRYSDEGYTEFVDFSGKLEKDDAPYIALGYNSITLISDKQVVTLEDPTFQIDDHKYFIVDFIQYTKHRKE